MDTNSSELVALGHPVQQSPETQLPSPTPTPFEVTAARVYDRFLNKHPQLKILEKFKKVPFLGKMVDQIQAKQLTLMEEAALEESGFDSKTGLLNTTGLELLVTDAAARMSRERMSPSGESWAVIFADINWFKKFNDVLGQAEGDIYLKEVAKLLEETVRSGEGDLACRHGGEEFLLIIRLKEGSSITDVVENQDNETSIVTRMATKIGALRNNYIQRADGKFTQKIKDFENDKSLAEMGVGSLSVGISYFSSEMVVDLYDQWVMLTDTGVTDESFVNFALLNKSHDFMKHHAKQVAHQRQGDNPVWVATQAANGTDVKTYPVSPDFAEKSLR